MDPTYRYSFIAVDGQNNAHDIHVHQGPGDILLRMATDNGTPVTHVENNTFDIISLPIIRVYAIQPGKQ